MIGTQSLQVSKRKGDVLTYLIDACCLLHLVRADRTLTQRV
jgi:hypothetical protein